MSDTELKAITFAPGINRNVTEYMAEGGWVECNRVRFKDGRPEKIGGWVPEPVQQIEGGSNLFTGTARDILGWTSLDSFKYLAVASNKKVELTFESKIYDITPIREENLFTDVINTTLGSSLVTIETGVTHQLSEGDFVIVNSQASTVDGINLLGEYSVTSIISPTEFEIDSGVLATGTTVGGGGDLDIDYLLECGPQSNQALTGYGGGTWNTPGAGGQGYNRPRSGGEFGSPMRQWKLDNWGEDLLACVSGGEIYHWDASLTNPATLRLATLEERLSDPTSDFYEPDPTLRAEKIAAYPKRNQYMLVALPSRIVVAFGSELIIGGEFDPLVIRWSDIESLTDWRIEKTNSAGEFRLPKGNRIVGAYQTRTEIIVFTDIEAYSMVFVGGSEVFRFTPLGTNTSIAGPHAAVDVNGIVMWMGLDDFYMYDGTIRPMPNTLDDFVFDQDGEGRLDKGQKEKVFAGVNKKFHEVWWFYPQEGISVDQDDILNYICFNYLENIWYYGEMPRSVWLDRGTFDTPLALGNQHILYSQENGKDDSGKPMTAFIRSAYFDIGDGTDFAFVDRILPDLKLPGTNTCKITIFTKRYPHPNARVTEKGPYIFSDADNKISMRARGRAMSVKYEVDGEGADFEIGKVRLGFQLDGRR